MTDDERDHENTKDQFYETKKMVDRGVNTGAGKGSTYRPVDSKKYREEYDRIFKGGTK